MQRVSQGVFQMLQRATPWCRERRERARLAVQVHGDHRLGAGRDCGLQPVRVQVVGPRVDVHEHRRRADVHHGAGAREERVGGRHDFVAWAHAERAQREDQGVGARGAADREAALDVAGDLLLEPRDLGASDEAGALEHAVDGRVEVRPERRVLRVALGH